MKNETGLNYKIMSWGCGILFSLFSFVYLYFYQGGVLAALQHVLSEGQTSYDNLIGASIITLILLLLAIFISTLYKQKSKSIASSLPSLSYLPSFVILFLLTNVNNGISDFYSFHIPSTIIVVLLLIGWCFLTFSRLTINVRSCIVANLLVMSLMMLLTGICSNGDEQLHRRMQLELQLMEGNYDVSEYLVCNPNELPTASSLSECENRASIMMLNAYSLSKQDSLGDKLFRTETAGTGKDLLPLRGSLSSTVFLSSDSIFRHLGAIPGVPMTTKEYLCIMSKNNPKDKRIGDYLLCSSLVDRNLDAFVEKLSLYYDMSAYSLLPRHYREALILYKDIKHDKSISIHDAEMENSYAEMKKQEAECPDKHSKLLKIRSDFHDTYWWYYRFASSIE